MAIGRIESIRLFTNQSSRPGSLAVRLTAVLETWAERRRQRLTLQGLSDYALKDIGLSRSEAEREARKPFWRG
ncbi:MAG: DUF1127 domain-containing protein [Geminicoccaceae bacterium]